MVYRVTDINVPDDNPFQYDALERKPVVEFLVCLIERLNGPFVLALDSPWGTGKTTMIRMLMAVLKQKNFECIHFNAWNVDYVTDPLVALVAAIDQLKLSNKEANEVFNEHIKNVKRVTSLIAKRAAVVTTKALTFNALDLEKEIEDAAAELAGGAVTDIVEAFQKEEELLGKLKSELEMTVNKLQDSDRQSTLIFFIDEIDRCRPTFAVELLERIKHLFELANIIFILSLDKKQLEASVKAVYGQGIDSTEYLRRFIDLEYAIPVVKSKYFIESLFARFELNDVFAERTHSELRYDRSQFIDFFTFLSDAVPLTLRSQERCITRLKVVLDQTPSNHYLEPVLVALLIILRTYVPDLYTGLCNGKLSAKDIMNYLRNLPGGKQIVTEHAGVVIEAYLIVIDKDEDRKNNRLIEIKKISEDKNNSDHERASDLLGMVKHIQDSRYRGIGLSKISRKIDLASDIRE